jgi:magnesium transporter
MGRFIKHARKKLGLPPGTLVHVGKKKTEKVHFRVIDYNETHLEERELVKVEELAAYVEKATVTWVDVIGIHDVEIIEKIGQLFGLHPLVLEDVMHSDQRPKLEDFDSYMFLICKMITYGDENSEIETEQFSLVVGSNYIISFQEREGDVFNFLRQRIRMGKGRIKKMGPDYLVYALIDAVVDHYFVVLEKLGEKIEILEDEVAENPDRETVQLIHHLKRELIFLRKSVWPLREAVGRLEKSDSGLIQEKTRIFLRDVYDHTIQVIDTVETYRDMASGMLDIYLSSMSNRMNEVMKVLTIIATIFIPLSFIAGIYGMNFKYMPELEWHWAYPILWFIMILIAATMLILFRKKKWL